MARPDHPPADALPTRPAFRDGQVLRAADLRAESADRVRAARRHQALAHLPGVVAGLWLRADGDKVHVSSGMASDATGRTILVAGEHTAAIPFRPAEVWIAYRETPADAAGERPAGPPDRYTEGFELLFFQPGEHDPGRSGDHPRRPVFLGTVLAPQHGALDNGNNAGTQGAAPTASPARKEFRHEGRVYVGAIGGRVEAASQRARVLLAPEGPTDLRLFALGTRPHPRDRYTDHLTMDSAGALHLLSPAEVNGRPGGTFAIVRAGHRPVEFHGSDIKAPLELAGRILDGAGPVESHLRERCLPETDAGALDQLRKESLASAARGQRAAVVLCRVLNRALADEGLPLAGLVSRAGVRLGSRTVRLALEHAAGSPRADRPLLHRLFLEDVFPGLLARLPDKVSELRGVSFAGPRPEPAEALPGRVYLTAITSKDQTRRELRVEIRGPGKGNNPERFKLVIGIAPSKPDDANKSPQQCLVVDASRTVTVLKDLKVYTRHADKLPALPDGLILRVRPKDADPDDPTSKAEQLGQVAPWDLVLRDVKAEHKKTAVHLSGQLANTGAAATIGVQLHAVLFAPSASDLEPIRETLLRGAVIEPAKPLPLADPEKPGEPIPIALPQSFQDKELTLILKAIGVGPANVLADMERRLVVRKPTP